MLKKAYQSRVTQGRSGIAGDLGEVRGGLEGGVTKDPEDTVGGKRYVHYLDCSDGFTDLWICQNSLIVHFKYIQFIIYQFYLNRAVFKKE